MIIVRCGSEPWARSLAASRERCLIVAQHGLRSASGGKPSSGGGCDNLIFTAPVSNVAQVSVAIAIWSAIRGIRSKRTSMIARDAFTALSDRQIDYSICTLVTDFAEHDSMMKSFHRRGFVADRCEFLYIDNSRSNRCDGFAGVNVFLRAAQGRYVVICHQDVELIDDGIEQLDARLKELDALDAHWAIAGNSGGKFMADLHDLAVRISDPHGDNMARGPFPQRVSAIDENFILVKNNANLATSSDLRGFHLYGMDLAVMAEILGHHTYVIDFHLRHKSPGKVRVGADLWPGETSLEEIRLALVKKYSLAFSPRWISSPVTEIFIRPRMLRHVVYNARETLKMVIRKNKLLRRAFRI